ncbi:MAG: hypothetical protein GDA46_06265 [Bdellovibrionales bacterium]|nr:hypothetical protein [Bdellovibrionales bacterium]
MKNKREAQLEKILVQMIQPLKKIPFELVIPSLFEVSVKKFDLKNSDNKKTLDKMAKAMSCVCKNIQKKLLKELVLGNDIEEYVIKALKAEKLNASTPKTKQGKITGIQILR